MPINSGEIYDQLLNLAIDLNFDQIPTPAYLQEKILECSDALRAVEKRTIEVTRELSSKEKNLKLETMRLDVKRRTLLVNDPTIKKLPTGKEREAAADEVLQNDHESILALENDVLEMQHLLSSIRLVHQNLRTTNSDIRTLMRIMEQQISRLNIGTKEDKEIKDLVAGLEEVELVEGEMTLDDVESSSEFVESEKPDVRSHEAPQIEEGSASDEGGSESEVDELDAVSAFLAEESEEIGGQTTAPGDEAEEGDSGDHAQSAVGKEGAKDNSVLSPAEAIDSDGGVIAVTDLDIDLGSMLLGSALVEEEQVAPPAKKSEATKPSKPAGKNKESKPAPVKKGLPEQEVVETELDIDDILSSIPD